MSNTQPIEQSVETRTTEMPAARAKELEQALELAKLALEAALDKKALEPLLLGVHELCSYTDYLLVVSGRSDRQVDAIAKGVVETLKKERGLIPLGVEGVETGQWALIDYGEVVIHVFHHPVREHYDLESLWNDAPRVPIEVPDDARISADEYL
jgi:ribosome-associated protein